jgi:hypothetical protein
LQPSTCILLQATSSNLKGTRKLQFFGFPRPLTTSSPFSGGVISGSSTGKGSATGKGSSETMDAATYIAEGETGGSAKFTQGGSSSGYISTMFGSAKGSGAGGATGEQAGSVSLMMGGVGTLEFDGTTTSSGTGGFGGGFSPVGSNFASTGPTGGFGSGSGSLGIESDTTGTLMGDPTTIGTGSSGGKATNYGNGKATGYNYFGSAGGIAGGTGTIAAAGSGNTKADVTNGVFTGSGSADGNFDNQGSGLFGVSATLTFP